MSGPKVVRIVTRQEIVAICERLLGQLDATVADWERVGRRNDTITEDDLAAVTRRRTSLRAMLSDERFLDLQKQVPAEIALLQDDKQQRLQQAASAISEARRGERRIARTAQSVLDELSRAEKDVPAELKRALIGASRGEPGGEAACARALSLLHEERGPESVTERQRELADALGRDERRVTLSDWMARQHAAADDPVFLRIDSAIADLQASVGSEVSRPFEVRAAAIGPVAPGPSRNLLADSLLLDLAAELKARRADEAAFARLEELDIALNRFESASIRELRTQIAGVLSARNAEQANALAVRANQALGAEEYAEAASARRTAVLRGMARLGYEVTEGMATGWVDSGRVVIRNPRRPGYGVEIAGGTQAERMQVRAVALGDPTAPRDTSRDHDVETLWCQDVKQLTTLLTEHGDMLEIQQARPVGAVPLKVILLDSVAAAADVDVGEHRRQGE